MIKEANKLTLFFLIIWSLFFIYACSADKPPTETQPPTNSKDSINKKPSFSIQKLSGIPFSVVIIRAKGAVYAQPSIQSKKLIVLSQGDSLVFTNQITTNTTAQLIENIPHNEPWLRVLLGDNTMGWIYGGNIGFDAQKNSVLTEKVLLKRAANFFGENTAELIQIYSKEQENIQSLPAFRLLYSRSSTLQDTIESKLNIWLTKNKENWEWDTPPDFFWLNGLLDGLLLHYIKAENKAYLFRDLKKWKNYAETTTDTIDDNFVAVLLASYQTDSIEFNFFDWQMPLNNGKICSTLGSGVHANVLEKINLVLSDSTGYFREETQAIKTALIDDITTVDLYWLSSEQILLELDQVLAKKYSFFDENDRVELKTKKQLILNHKKHNIQVNLFEG